jgi:hypothetical protein
MTPARNDKPVAGAQTAQPAVAATAVEPAVVDRERRDGAVREHLLLGINYPGMRRFLVEELRMGVVEPGGLVFKPVQEVRNFGGYCTDGSPDSWIATAFPDKLTCYDLNAMVKKWLKDNNAMDKSVCEVLQERGYMDEDNVTQDYSHPAVGKAKEFLSHTQIEHPFNVDSMMAMIAMSHGGSHRPPVWIDAFCLRQWCSGEFDPVEIVELIARIGRTSVSLDKQRLLYTRSFCLLETYASVKARARVDIYDMAGKGHIDGDCIKYNLCCCIKMCPCYDFDIKVDSAAASTRRVEDKALIDEYISKNIEGGHSVLNQEIEREIEEGMHCGFAQNFTAVYCCPCYCCCCCRKWCPGCVPRFCK